MDVDPISAYSLVASARALVGTRWRHRGRTADGVDCIGMVTLSMANAGMNPVERFGFLDTRDYSREANPELLRQVEQYCTRISAIVPGALVLFQFPNDSFPRHFGIYTHEGTIIHANVRMAKVVEHGYRMHWPKWTHSLWKLPGVNYE